ncbi:MAG: sulfur carrier protein ThiS [Actinomycetota bacterium]|nr:sulfur carrier protein ThiS [Actinomycetota bacterium]
MNVVINGTATELDAHTTLKSVVGKVANDQRGVAAAVNGEVVPRHLWDTTELAVGDKVEILSAIGGG